MNLPSANPQGSDTAARGLAHAGFFIRVVAGVIDLVIVLIPFCVVVSFAAVGLDVWNDFFFNMRPGRPLPESLAERGPTLVAIGVAVFILFGWLYFALLESSVWRGTFGKHVLGLYVADERGHPIDFWQATKRFLLGRLLLHVPIVGVCYFLADCLCIALLSPQRAIHDILARCLVLKENHRS